MSTEKKMTAIDEQELAAAKNEAAATDTTSYTHKLATPFTYGKKTYTELTFHWGKLTGNDSLAIENELQSFGKAVIVPELSGEYLIRMAARACSESVGADGLIALPITDYNKIRAKARSFLMRLGS